MGSNDIYIREESSPATEALSMTVTVLLIIFFPIGIIVLIVRTISRLKNEHVERNATRASIEQTKSATSISNSQELQAYYALYEQGILDKEEFEAKKRNILAKQKIKPKRIKA